MYSRTRTHKGRNKGVKEAADGRDGDARPGVDPDVQELHTCAGPALTSGWSADI